MQYYAQYVTVSNFHRHNEILVITASSFLLLTKSTSPNEYLPSHHHAAPFHESSGGHVLGGIWTTVRRTCMRSTMVELLAGVLLNHHFWREIWAFQGLQEMDFESEKVAKLL